ncbi:META domain-containing protein [Psychromonas sp.]|uniref:META domain-containing protein n=1 Tax=Psychromonas sp. TaxID=1884585 RepID=UPI003561976A
MNICKPILLLLTSLSLFACSAETLSGMESQPIALAQIQKQWHLIGIDGQTISPGINSTFQVDKQSRVAGKLACNNFFGTLILQDNRLKVDPMGSTRMMCPKPMNEIEMVISSVFNDWSDIQLTANKLILSGKKHTLTYKAN